MTQSLAAAHADHEASAADWGAHEDAKSSLLMQLAAFGPAASAAAPVALAVLHDEHAYRDTLYYAKKALVAMGREAVRVLVNDIARTPTWEALEALGEMPGDELAAVETLPPVLVGVLRGDDELLARRAAWVAMRMGGAAAPLADELVASCERYAGDDDRRLFDYAVEALVNIGTPAEAGLRRLLASERSEVRRRAAVEVALAGGDRAMVDTVLREVAELGEGWEREQARELLGLDGEEREQVAADPGAR